LLTGVINVYPIWCTFANIANFAKIAKIASVFAGIGCFANMDAGWLGPTQLCCEDHKGTHI